MPKLGNKEYAYTKKGVAAYKAAKRKGSKMNESTRKRLLDLMVEMKMKRKKGKHASGKKKGEKKPGLKNVGYALKEGGTTVLGRTLKTVGSFLKGSGTIKKSVL